MKPNKLSSRLLALALSLVLSLFLSLPALAAGEDGIIYIHTAKDLCALSDSCAYDAWSRGKTVLLTADISLRGVDFEPIASFSGTFNGGGHTISGLTLTDSLSPAGLFLALERGAVVTDARMRTNVPGVWAIGDCNGKLMLAHTAYREAEVAVNDMLGKKDRIDYSIIPSVIYTTPEVACVGETEQSAKEKGLDVQVVKAPMALSGRYLAENPKGDGFCKLLYDRKNRCVVGVHLVGSYASEIIYGAAMMVHSKLPVQHLDKIVFPHPTVGEVVREALFLL